MPFLSRSPNLCICRHGSTSGSPHLIPPLADLSVRDVLLCLTPYPPPHLEGLTLERLIEMVGLAKAGRSKDGGWGDMDGEKGVGGWRGSRAEMQGELSLGLGFT